MKPIKFKYCNLKLKGCKNISDLDVYRGQGLTISKWKLSFKDIIKIIFTRSVWFSMYNDKIHPPIKLSIDNAFDKEKK